MKMYVVRVICGDKFIPLDWNVYAKDEEEAKQKAKDRIAQEINISTSSMKVESVEFIRDFYEPPDS